MVLSILGGADSEFLIVFGMKRRWRGRDVFECDEVLWMAMCVCVCVCVFLVLGRYRKRHLGWASAVGGTQVVGLNRLCSKSVLGVLKIHPRQLRFQT